MKIKSNINTTVEYMQDRIRALNGLVAASLFVLFLVNVWLMYEFVAFLSKGSIVGILGSMSIFLVAMFFMTRGLSRAMYAAFHRYNIQLENLLKDMRDMRNIPYMDVLLEKTLQAAQSLVEADGGAIFIAEDDKLVPRVVTGGSDLRPKKESIARWCGPVGMALERGIPMIVNDLEEDRRFQEGTGNAGLPEQAASVICIPLRLRNQAIGAIELINKKGTRDFSVEDSHLLEFLAAQAAAGLEHARFHEEKKNYEIHFTSILIEAIENLNEKRGHAKRIAKYALMMADDLGFGYEDKKRLYRAALLHDIGFIRLNPKKVSSPSQYQQHVLLGYNMLNPIDLYHDVAPFVLHHHERYDGHGYPEGLRGDNIPLESRILFVAEAFDAMVSTLSYKNIGTMLNDTYAASTVRIKDALKELKRNAGTQFDPRVVDVFIKRVLSEDIQDLAEDLREKLAEIKTLAA